MLKQASIADIRNGTISRVNSHIVVAMRFYPRFLKKELRDEFICELAPVKDLLKHFNSAQKQVGHNLAFPEVDYEQRFNLSEVGFAQLRRLAELSTTKDVYLICICDLGQRCHREILMLMAQQLFGCSIDHTFHTYPTFMQRLTDQTPSF